MTGGLGAVENTLEWLANIATRNIPDSSVVTLVGSLTGPGDTVVASTVQPYMVNGESPVTVPIVSLNVP